MNKNPLKAGIFGGTFDPVHLGHLITAQSVLLKRNLDTIIFIPCYISPHKTNKPASLSIHRLNMIKLAIEGYDKFTFSDFEIAREGISYSIDTIMHLKEEYDELELIIGFDSLVTFDTWKEPDKITDLVKLVVMNRSHNAEIKNRNRFFERAVFVDTPVIDISATEIREKIKSKLPVNFLVPEKVLEYITDNGLYK